MVAVPPDGCGCDIQSARGPDEDVQSARHRRRGVGTLCGAARLSPYCGGARAASAAPSSRPDVVGAASGLSADVGPLLLRAASRSFASLREPSRTSSDFKVSVAIRAGRPVALASVSRRKKLTVRTEPRGACQLARFFKPGVIGLRSCQSRLLRPGSPPLRRVYACLAKGAFSAASQNRRRPPPRGPLCAFAAGRRPYRSTRYSSTGWPDPHERERERGRGREGGRERERGRESGPIRIVR